MAQRRVDQQFSHSNSFGYQYPGQSTPNVLAYQYGINNSIRINNGEACQESGCYKKPKQPEVPKHILENKNVIDSETIGNINESVGKNWRKLARVLGIAESDIQNIEHMHHGYGYGEYCLQAILKWKQYNGNEATVGKLAEALVKVELSVVALNLENKNVTDKL